MDALVLKGIGHKKEGFRPPVMMQTSSFRFAHDSTEGVEEQIREEAIPFDQDPCSDREPDGSNDRCS